MQPPDQRGLRLLRRGHVRSVADVVQDGVLTAPAAPSPRRFAGLEHAPNDAPSLVFAPAALCVWEQKAAWALGSGVAARGRSDVVFSLGILQNPAAWCYW